MSRDLRGRAGAGTPVVDRRVSTAPGKSTLTGQLPAVQRASRSDGVPLPDEVRDQLEPQIGAGLADVRVHTGATSAEAAAQLDARAYTTGQDIHFGDGEYRPDDPFGMHLIAHEVAHTVQQGEASEAEPQLASNGLDVSDPGDPHEREAERFADAVVAGHGATAIAPVSRRSVSRAVQRDDKATPGPVIAPAAVPEAPKLLPFAKVREHLVAGEYNGAGKAAYTETEVKKGNPPATVKVFEKFVDPNLQAALDYCLTTWAPAVKAAAVGAGGGDSSAKAVDSHPAWVEEFQIKLAVQQAPNRDPAKKKFVNPKGPPQWSEDSELVQAVLSAFLHEWTRRISGGKEATANVSELYGRVGDSEHNERARLIGGEPKGPNWCGPASEYSAALGLMRRGLRFQGQDKNLVAAKDIPKLPANPSESQKAAHEKTLRYLHARALQYELIHQGSLFLTRWFRRQDRTGKSKQKSGVGEHYNRGASGKTAETTPLMPGDEIYLTAKASPLSGHVATVIREERLLPDPIDREKTPAGTIISKVYCVSGNAGSHGDGAVRVEQVMRELPPKEFNYDQVAEFGNKHDRLRDAAGKLRSDARKEYQEKLRSLFLADVLADKANHFVQQRKAKQAAGKPVSLNPDAIQIEIYNYATTYWDNWGAVQPHLRGNAGAYKALLVAKDAEYGEKTRAADGALADYKKLMEQKKLPYNKSGAFDAYNTDRRVTPNKMSALTKMQQYFMKHWDKSKFTVDPAKVKLGERIEDKRLGAAMAWFSGGNHKYDKAAMEAHLLPGKLDGYVALLDQFGKTEKELSPPAEAKPDDATPAEPKAAEPKAAEPKAADAKPAVPVTGNYCPTIDGHIWVTSIVRAGNVDPSKIEAEIKEAQQAAAKGKESELDPAAKAPDVDQGAARKEVLDNWGLEDLNGTIESLWPGALAYWDGTGAF